VDIKMQYTEKNLRAVLRKIDPMTYDIYNDKAKMALPEIIKAMFTLGFYKALKSSFGMAMFFSETEMDILIRGYKDLYGTGKVWFEFEEE
jgi:hypothetical protein